MTFGEKLRQLREAKALKREELADEIGVSYQAVVLYENDIVTPSLKRVGKICKVFRIEAEEMFKGVELF